MYNEHKGSLFSSVWKTGLDAFLDHAFLLPEAVIDGTSKCPCTKCDCCHKRKRHEMEKHLCPCTKCDCRHKRKRHEMEKHLCRNGLRDGLTMGRLTFLIM
jgi:hypothetical protein